VDKETFLDTPIRGWVNTKCRDPLMKYRFRVTSQDSTDNNGSTFKFDGCCEEDIFAENNCGDNLPKKGSYVSNCTADLLLDSNCCLTSYSSCLPEFDGDIEEEDENGDTNSDNDKGRLPCCRTFQKEAGVTKDSVDLCALRSGVRGPDTKKYYCKAPYSGSFFTDILTFDQDSDDGSDDYDEEYVPGIMDTSYCCKGFGNKIYHIGHFTTWGRHQELCCKQIAYRYAALDQLKDNCCLLPFRRGNESDAFPNEPLCDAGVPCCLKNKKCPDCGGYPFDKKEIAGTDRQEERFDARYFVEYDKKKKNCPRSWVRNANRVKKSGEVYYSGDFRTHNRRSYFSRFIKKQQRRLNNYSFR